MQVAEFEQTTFYPYSFLDFFLSCKIFRVFTYKLTYVL